VFADPKTIKEEVVTYIALEHEFEIPPNVSDYRVALTFDGLPENSRLLAMAPHMHVRGKAFKVTARFPDERSEILLDIPHYDFNWQNGYSLAEPLTVPAGLMLECESVYDNSDKNLANPDPNASVRWGDQTWEEMMIGFFEVAVPVGTDHQSMLRRRGKKVLSENKRLEAEQATRAWIKRFDHDGDGVIVRDDVPDTFEQFAFKQIDRNRDDAIDFDEAYQHALRNKR
jgi:hypothetical protein